MRTLFAGAYALYFAVLALLALCIAAPLLALLPRLAWRRRLVSLLVRGILLLSGIPVRRSGMANLPTTPCVAVANHASYLDGPLLMALLPPRFTFIVHDGVRRWPLIGWLVARTGATFISRHEPRRAAAQTRALVRRLRDGESLLIFPEGGFKPEPGLQRFKRGGFAMSASADVPIVPLVIIGTRQLYGGGRRLPRHSRLDLQVLPASSASADVDAQRDAVRSRMVAACVEGDALPVETPSAAVA